MPDRPQATLHASTVAWQDRACLIQGASGQGKSTLALELISRGCDLVADDRTLVWAEGGQALAALPAPIAGLIEARGAGLIRMPHRAPVAIALVVDLDRTAKERMPIRQMCSLQGISCPVIVNTGCLSLPATVLAVLHHGLADDNDF